MDKVYYILLLWSLSWEIVDPFPFCRCPCHKEDNTCPEQNLNLNCCFKDEYYQKGNGIQLTEGDIFHTEIQIGFMSMSINTIWPERLVPYQLDPSYSEDEKKKILNAIFDLESKTCIRFCDRIKENSECGMEPDFIKITKGSGCYSPVGRLSGGQILSLGDVCLNRLGTIQHELMHALGFLHEHNRYDRDQKLEVMKQNIQDGKEENFRKRSVPETDNDYDFFSLMHYSLYAFSKDDKMTLVPKIEMTEKEISQIGQRNALSKKDVKKLNHKYNCQNVECAAPPYLAKGYREFTSRKVGHKVYYKCMNGFILFGAKERQCQLDGTWSGQQPYCFTKEEYHMSSCTFDETENLCGWKNYGWTQQRFATPTVGTGPDGDETEMGSHLGQYLYLESSSRNPGYTVTLMYNIEECSYNTGCISLWYNMYGDETMGSLTIYTENNGEKSELLKFSGNQGRGWKFAAKCFKCAKKIEIQAVRGETYKTDIGIDEVLVTNKDVMSKYCNEIRRTNNNVDCSMLE